jgi:hypothetical protein
VEHHGSSLEQAENTEPNKSDYVAYLTINNLCSEVCWGVEKNTTYIGHFMRLLDNNKTPLEQNKRNVSAGEEQPER